MNMREQARVLSTLGFPAASWRQPPVDFIEQLPIAIFACDAAGRLLWFNTKAADLWGRSPHIGDDSELHDGACQLYLDGRPIARNEAPMAEVLRTGMPVRWDEGQIERPDGSQIRATIFSSSSTTM